MEGFKKGFYITSQKKERKQEDTLGTSSYTYPQHFSNKSPGIQQEEREQPKKTTHTETPTSEEQPRKQIKSALQQEISKFNPSDQMSMEQLIKVLLNLQEKVQKLKHLKEKLMLKLEEKYENGCRTLSLTSDETNPDQEEMLLLRKPVTPLSKQPEIPIETTRFLIRKANRKNQIEQDFLQQE